jgi:hypothetical protein
MLSTRCPDQIGKCDSSTFAPSTSARRATADKSALRRSHRGSEPTCAWLAGRSSLTNARERRMAERVGFEPSRGELKARRAMPWKPARADKTECNEVLAERVGFEPTCRLPDKTLSRRPRYDHFGTSPCQNRVNQTSQYTARVANVWAGGRARFVSAQRSVRRRGLPWTCPRWRQRRRISECPAASSACQAAASRAAVCFPGANTIRARR